MALVQSLNMDKRSMFYARFTIEKNAVPLNLVGIGGDFKIKSAVDEDTTYATWTTGGGQITTDGSGHFTVKVNTATVNALPSGVPLEYVARLTPYDIDAEAATAGFDFRFAQGELIVSEDP